MDSAFPEVFAEVRAQSLGEHRAQCTLRARLHSQKVAGYVEIVNTLTAEGKAQYRYHCAEWIGAVYGSGPAAVARLIHPEGGLNRDKIGQVDPGLPQSMPAHSATATEHRLSELWGVSPAEAAGWLAKMGLGQLNRELRGISRALWLSCLWGRLDVETIRAEWYHWADVAPYWPAAWACSRDPAAMAQLIDYGRAVAQAYTDAHPKRRTHKAVSYINAAAALIA